MYIRPWIQTRNVSAVMHMAWSDSQHLACRLGRYARSRFTSKRPTITLLRLRHSVLEDTALLTCRAARKSSCLRRQGSEPESCEWSLRCSTFSSTILLGVERYSTSSVFEAAYCASIENADHQERLNKQLCDCISKGLRTRGCCRTPVYSS